MILYKRYCRDNPEKKAHLTFLFRSRLTRFVYGQRFVAFKYKTVHERIRTVS